MISFTSSPVTHNSAEDGTKPKKKVEGSSPVLQKENIRSWKRKSPSKKIASGKRKKMMMVMMMGTAAHLV